MQYQNIKIQKEDKLFEIYIHRPKQLNALNTKTINELHDAITTAEKDKNIRCIIITGEGEKAFVAGADIKEFINFNKNQGESLARENQEALFDLLENSSKPSIAAINGFALGGGLELAMSCHIRIASENAKMGLPEVSLGLIPGYGGTQRLTQLVGKGIAFEMITTAQMIDANKAKEYGLINHVCTQQNLLLRAREIAKKITHNSPLAISKAIKAINSGFNNDLDGFEVEKKEFGSCFGTDDFIEGTTAFMEKRKAKF